jgi:hypothetical protein
MDGLGVALIWNNWRRTDACKHAMAATSFAGVSFDTIFLDAMRLVFINEQGQLGLLYQHVLLQHAMDEIALNGGKHYGGYNDAWVRLLLYHGLFTYNSGFLPLDQALEFDALSDQVYANSDQPGIVIRINPSFIVGIANSLSFPQNATGVDQLRYVVGCTVLHEIMHNQHGGWSHPTAVNYTAGSDYASSLPFVAERAVCRASPYWATFKGYYDNNLWLVPGAVRTCGNGQGFAGEMKKLVRDSESDCLPHQIPMILAAAHKGELSVAEICAAAKITEALFYRILRDRSSR